MTGRNRFGCMSVFVLLIALVATEASAQSNFTKVSDVIEGGSNANGGVSIARCGVTLVAGFGDVEPDNPNSSDGVSVSRNGGKSFLDRGTLPSSTDSIGGFSDLRNSPAVACSSPTQFYYASAGSVPNPTFGPPCPDDFSSCTAILLSASSNGGAKWSQPRVVAAQPADIYALLSPSIAVDPSNPARLYITYIEDDQSNSEFQDCGGGLANVVKIVGSADGGATWTQPAIVDHSCSLEVGAPQAGTLSGTSIAVSPDGNLYLTYEFSSNDTPTTTVRFSRSLDHGNTFSQPFDVSSDASRLDGTQAKIGVDRSLSAYRGSIYIAWPGSPSGTNTDIEVAESTDSGQSFSFPRSVSAPAVSGNGRFQKYPVLAVAKDGQVAACFYETPTNQPRNDSVYSYNCATSSDNAATWQVQPLLSSAPAGYDALASDFLLTSGGFFTAFEVSSNGNRNVVGGQLGTQ